MILKNSALSQSRKWNILKVNTVLIIFLIIYPVLAQAQEDKHQETVTVVGDYTPELLSAKKILFSPQIKDTLINKNKMNYGIKSVPIENNFEVKPISAAKMIGETFQKLYKNHIIVGLGNYWTPYIDFNHHSYRNKKLRGEIHLKHLSSNGEIEDYAFPGYSEDEFGMSGNFIKSEYLIFTRLNYLRETYHYYGFIPNDTVVYDNSDIKQIFNKLSFTLKGKSLYKSNYRFHNEFALQYQGLWDKYNTNENNIILSANFKKNINIAKFFKNETVYIDANGGFFNQNYELNKLSTGITSIKPYLKVELNELELNAGGNLSMQLDSVGDILFFPYLRLDLTIIPESFKVFIGTDGMLEKNTFRNLTDVNPFINTEIIPIEYTTTKNMIYGGINGGFSGIFNYIIMAKNRKVINLPMFINDTLPMQNNTNIIVSGNRFNVIYNDVDIFTLSGEFKMDTKKLQIGLGGEYNVYAHTVWHLPDYKANISVSYNIADKIYGRLNVFAYGSRYALIDNVEKKLDPIYDFNLEFEYRYTKFLSIFARFNNFIAQRYCYWNNYPSQRLNFMGGISYTF
jgi:hypothetical protein